MRSPALAIFHAAICDVAAHTLIEALLDGVKHMTVSGYEPVILTSQDVEAELDSLQKQPGPQDNSKDG